MSRRRPPAAPSDVILQISPYYPPHIGGLERVVESLAAGLGQRHNVQVLTSTIGAGTEPRRSRHGRVTVLRHRSFELAHTPIVPGIITALWRAPRSAVLHLHTAHAVLPELVALTARCRGQRFLVHFHLDVDASGPLGWLLPAYKKQVFGRVLRAAAGVIVLTEAQADFVRSAYRVPDDRVFVVPNGVAAAFFRPVRREHRPADRPFRLLYLGRLSPQKNVGRLLQAMRLVRQPIQLTVVGDGEQARALQEQAAELGLSNVTFAGPRTGPDLPRAYADADAFVLPSDREGMPLVALEAMAAALPIVATDVPGNTDLLHGVALLCKPEPGALAEALDTVAGDRELCRVLAGRSAEAARGHTWEAVLRRVEDVYAEVRPAQVHR